MAWHKHMSYRNFKAEPFMMTEELSTKDDGLDPILAQDDKKALTVLTDL